MAPQEALAVALGILGFILLWLAIMALAAWIGGWRRLAQAYPAAASPIVKRFRFQSLALWMTNYGNCVTVDVTTQGLRFAVMWPLRFAHRPVEIPWDELEVRRTRRMGLWPVVRLRGAKAPTTQLEMSARLGDKIAQVAGEFWRAAETRGLPSETPAA